MWKAVVVMTCEVSGKGSMAVSFTVNCVLCMM